MTSTITQHTNPASKNTQSSSKSNNPVANQACISAILQALDDIKAKDIVTMDVTHITDVTDAVVIASGSSNRHVRALASHVAETAKKAGFQPIGIEGEDDGEWVLVDLSDVVVHILLPKARTFYDLENLWRNPDHLLQVS